MTKYYSEQEALQHLVKYPNDVFTCESTDTLVACRLAVSSGDPIVFTNYGQKLDLNECTERSNWELVAKTYTTIQAMTMLLSNKTLRFVAPNTEKHYGGHLIINGLGNFEFTWTDDGFQIIPRDFSVSNRSDWRIERD